MNIEIVKNEEPVAKSDTEYAVFNNAFLHFRGNILSLSSPMRRRASRARESVSSCHGIASA